MAWEETVRVKAVMTMTMERMTAMTSLKIARMLPCTTTEKRKKRLAKIAGRKKISDKDEVILTKQTGLNCGKAGIVELDGMYNRCDKVRWKRRIDALLKFGEKGIYIE